MDADWEKQSKARLEAAQQEFETGLRAKCRVLCNAHPRVPRIRTIAAVGAYDGVIGGHQNDSARLTAAIEYLLDSGFPIDPDFEVDVVNFREGRDFLFEDKKADLVFISYILGTSFNSYSQEFTLRAIPEDTSPMGLNSLLSRIHNPGTWLWHARHENQAKVIATYGGYDEMGTPHFCSPLKHKNRNPQLYYELIASTTHCIGSTTSQPLTELYPDCPGIDVPMGGLAFCADQDYLKKLRPSLNDETYMGRHALDMISPVRKQLSNPFPRFPAYI